MPHQANVAGNIHGGEIIKLMDSTAYATARRYARTNVVTASRFLSAIWLSVQHR